MALLWLAALAPSAHAFSWPASTWTSPVGLTAADGASWVRTFALGAGTDRYAGTEGSGVYESVDPFFGATWTPDNTGLQNAPDGGGMSVREVYVDNGTVYAATSGGLFSQPDSPNGSTWTPLAQGPETDPSSPTKLNQAVQAVLDVGNGTMLAGTVSAGVFSSTDSGATWKPPADDNGMPQDTTVWGFANFAGFIWCATNNGIFRSLDGGASWSLSSDGIPSDATTLGVFQDDVNPTVFYAETDSDGAYRSVDGGITWQSLNGDPNHEPFGGSSTPTIHAMRDFPDNTGKTKLYTATDNGLWVGTVPSDPTASLNKPGAIVWRHLTSAGLGSNTIMWGLEYYFGDLSLLFAGTQSNGGYGILLYPPQNDGKPADLPSWTGGALQRGTHLTGTPGTWTGTPPIDYSYQWQRCTSNAASSCSEIANANTKGYTLAKADIGKYLRLVVTATNDFPGVTQVWQAASALSAAPVAVAPAPLPGDASELGPTIVDVTQGGNQFSVSPNEGDTLSAPPDSSLGWFFSPPATTVSYQWLRCDADGNNCVDIPGATSQKYVLTSDDAGLTVAVEVTGTNSTGQSNTLPISAPTFLVIPTAAQDLKPPKVSGDSYVGYTLVGGVGSWAPGVIKYTRQWEQCTSSGTDCSPIQGATNAGYKVQPGDLGYTLRLHVQAFVSPPNIEPGAVDAYSTVTAAVTHAPSTGGGGSGGGGGGGGGGGVSKSTPPVVTKPKIESHGGQTTIVFSVSSGGGSGGGAGVGGSVMLVLEHQLKGHRARHGRCVAGRRKHHRRCTFYKVVYRVREPVSSAGTVSIKLPTRVHGRALPRGDYRLLLTPYSADGHAGKPHTILLVLRRR